jgi:hypothetical protein
LPPLQCTRSATLQGPKVTYTDANSTPAKQNRRTWRKKAAQYAEMARCVRREDRRAALERCAEFCGRMADRST